MDGIQAKKQRCPARKKDKVEERTLKWKHEIHRDSGYALAKGMKIMYERDE